MTQAVTTRRMLSTPNIFPRFSSDVVRTLNTSFPEDPQEDEVEYRLELLESNGVSWPDKSSCLI